MNLAAMRRMIADETQHEPDVTAWRQDIARVLTRASVSVCDERDWPFLVRRMPFWQYPDITLAAGEYTATVGNRSVQINDTGDLSSWLKYDWDDEALYRWMSALIDAEVEFDRDELVHAPGQYNPVWDAPFKVERVVLSSGDQPPAAIIFWLDPRAFFDAQGVGTMRIVWRRRGLPASCKRPLCVVDENGCKLDIITRDTAHAMYAGSVDGVYSTDILDQSGSVGVYVLDEGFEPRFGPARIHNLPALSTGNIIQHSVLARANRAPQVAISAAASTGGTLAVGTYWVIAAWEYGGRVGAASEPVEVALSGLNTRIVVTIPGMDSAGYGRHISVWMASASEAAFYRVGEAAAANTTTYNIDADPRAAGTFSNQALTRYDDVYSEHYQYLRPFQRPTKMERHTLEYLARPNELIEATDMALEGAPEAFYQAIVHRALVDIGIRHNSSAFTDVQRALYGDKVSQLASRYGVDAPSAKASIGTRSGGIPSFNGLIDWRGP